MSTIGDGTRLKQWVSQLLFVLVNSRDCLEFLQGFHLYGTSSPMPRQKFLSRASAMMTRAVSRWTARDTNALTKAAATNRSWYNGWQENYEADS